MKRKEIYGCSAVGIPYNDFKRGLGYLHMTKIIDANGKVLLWGATTTYLDIDRGLALATFQGMVSKKKARFKIFIADGYSEEVVMRIKDIKKWTKD